MRSEKFTWTLSARFYGKALLSELNPSGKENVWRSCQTCDGRKPRHYIDSRLRSRLGYGERPKAARADFTTGLKGRQRLPKSGDGNLTPIKDN